MTRRTVDGRPGFTLVELLAVMAIIAILIGLLLSAVQKVRSAAARAICLDKLRQLGLALHQYHGSHHALPPGHRSWSNPDRMPYSGWTLSVLPYLEQGALSARSQAAYRAQPYPFGKTPHAGLSTPVAAFACPADPRAPGPQAGQRSKDLAALTCYLGVSGKDGAARDGVLFQDSRVRLADVTDGTSYTLALGERPASADLQLGWWYAGVGLASDGSADLVLGVRERNPRPVVAGSPCGPGTYRFAPGRFDDPCAAFHFWSPHAGGTHFALADGSVRFLTYDADGLLPALASRAGGEPAGAD